MLLCSKRLPRTSGGEDNGLPPGDVPGVVPGVERGVEAGEV
jgi:hypothetical protein